MNTELKVPNNRFADQSPFHEGERMLHQHIGMSAEIEAMGRKVIRSFMPDQHRAFFSGLSYVLVGSVDEQGWPWASVLAGESGFITSSTPTELTINAQVQAGNPISRGIIPDAPVGLLGIELATRRRNRMNARVSNIEADSFTLAVDQSMGNCPRYIQPRNVQQADNPSVPQPQLAEAFTTLDSAAETLIGQADTMFVASYAQQQNNPEVEGVDVSHRGGQPGFISIEGNVLIIPDYSGNNVFMTLGNFLMVPKAGLLFIDFETGDLLMLTGRVGILWDDDPAVQLFAGAKRAWRFELDHGVKLTGALPFTFRIAR
ncbi:MAG: pyridoxamine 5'-phosphate oxidase family protein [Amphritea sp.]|nr:pyridoxamine 5'-phosphate oxidase family protein [Amphritea sp.]